MQLATLLPLLLGTVLVGAAIGASNSTQNVKDMPLSNESVSGEVRTSTNCTEKEGDSCCSCGAEGVLQSVRDIAESVRKLATAVENSNLLKGEPHESL